MKRIGWTWPALAVALLVFGSGCLIMHQSTRVIRENEPLRPMRFESEQARSVFEASVNELKAHKKGPEAQVFAIPFLCFFSRTTMLSDNALYNDQAVLCDANGDSLITEQEANAYRAQVTEKIAAARAKEGEASGDQSETVSLRGPDSGRSSRN